MPIWDIQPCYLNRRSLLGEHRELHALATITRDNLKGYSSHPETKRWKGHGWALKQRHLLLVAEMNFLGYKHHSSIRINSGAGTWPTAFIDTPASQFEILNHKYTDKECGRIPLPKTTQELWSTHKYSVLARDQYVYRELGQRISRLRGNSGFSKLALELTELIRIPPKSGEARNAVHHMWGHMGDRSGYPSERLECLSCMLQIIREYARKNPRTYLSGQTAVIELSTWNFG